MLLHESGARIKLATFDDGDDLSGIAWSHLACDNCSSCAFVLCYSWKLKQGWEVWQTLTADWSHRFTCASTFSIWAKLNASNLMHKMTVTDISQWIVIHSKSKACHPLMNFFVLFFILKYIFKFLYYSFWCFTCHKMQFLYIYLLV